MIENVLGTNENGNTHPQNEANAVTGKFIALSVYIEASKVSKIRRHILQALNKPNPKIVRW